MACISMSVTGPDDPTFIPTSAPTARGTKPASSGEPWDGRVLDGRFRIERFLASGSTGAVFVAQDLQLQVQVAVKVLHGNATADVERRFRSEVKVLARLRDPRIIRPISWGTVDERVYLVTELLHGTPLDRKLERVGRVPPRRILRLMIDVCRALGEAHAAGVVHRDLKPGNLFVERSRGGDENCRVLDFGIAKVAQNSSLLTEAPAPATDPGLLVGTVSYMSPEQINGGEVDGRCDLYALGIILFFALTGRRPYTGDPVEVLKKHLSSPIPAFSEVAPDLTIHPEVEALVRRLLAKTPEGRPSSAQQARQEIERLLMLSDLDRPGPAKPKRKVAGWLLAAVVAGAVGLAIWLASS